MAPKVGLEPTTDRLTADCSTTELLRNIRFRLILSTFIIIETLLDKVNTFAKTFFTFFPACAKRLYIMPSYTYSKRIAFL